MKVEKFVIGMIQTNCYLVQNEESKECFLVDPAICPEELVSHIKSEGLVLKAILLTHGILTILWGLMGFLKDFRFPVYAHEEEQGLLNDAVLNASAEYGPGYTFSGAEYLKDGQKLTAAGMEIEVLYTPGHTIGGMLLLYSCGRCTVQRGYPVLDFHRQRGSAHRKLQRAGAVHSG